MKKQLKQLKKKYAFWSAKPKKVKLCTDCYN